MSNNPALAALRHHVSGAIARGEAEAIAERPVMHTRTRPDLSNRLPVRDGVESLTYHRNPTPAEIRFGEGATHYLDFAIEECCHEGTRIPKRWVIGRLDGLRYYR